MRPNWLLILLPTAVGISTINFAVSVYLTACLAVWAARCKPQLQLTWMCAALPVAGLGIALRPNFSNWVLSVALFCLACFVAVRGVQVSASKPLPSLVDGVGLFLIASVGLWLVGVTGAYTRTSGLENTLTGGQRVVFPLSGSLAATPAMAAVFVAAVIPLLPHRKWFRLTALVCAVTIFILGDTRGALVAAVLLGAAVLLVPRLFQRAGPWLIPATMIVPFQWDTIRDSFSYTVTAVAGLVPWLIRPDERIGTLSSRDLVWSRAWTYYAERVDWFHQMVGYGTAGHYESGASLSYARHFSGFGDTALVSPHSSALQVLFDGGWLTALVFAVAIIVMAVKLHDLTGLAALAALAVVGVTEVALAPNMSQPTWWILLTLSVITFAKDSESAELSPQRVDLSETGRPALR